MVRMAVRLLCHLTLKPLWRLLSRPAQVLNPAGFEKMQAMSSKFRSFDDVAKALIAVTEKQKELQLS